jgi:hypothetical protein
MEPVPPLALNVTVAVVVGVPVGGVGGGVADAGAEGVMPFEGAE